MKRLKYLMVALLMIVSSINVYLATQNDEEKGSLTLSDIEAEGANSESSWLDDLHSAIVRLYSTPKTTMYDDNGQKILTGLPGTNFFEYQMYVTCNSFLDLDSQATHQYLRYCGYGGGNCVMSQHFCD